MGRERQHRSEANSQFRPHVSLSQVYEHMVVVSLSYSHFSSRKTVCNENEGVLYISVLTSYSFELYYV